MADVFKQKRDQQPAGDFSQLPTELEIGWRGALVLLAIVILTVAFWNYLPDRGGVVQALGQGLFLLFGSMLAWSARWLARQPDRDFSQISLWHNAGRLLLILAAVLLCATPVVWLLSKM